MQLSKTYRMKKLVTFALALLCAVAINAYAGEGKKSQLTDEQKAQEKTLLDKYDKNKDGKIDKEEKAAFSPEDKEAWDKLHPHKKKN